MIIIRFIVLLFIIAASVAVRGQYFIRGQDPAGIRWKQIHTRHFQLIFPEDYASRAAYLADLLEHSYEPASASLGHKPRKVPVILHNRSVVHNGFVSWAPARIELFTTPPPGNDVHNWHERLAIHELRHVVQVDMLNRGVTRALSVVFGEQATGAVLGLFVPLWLLEGDAVATETALTYGGRGRLPHFEQGLRAQLLEKGPYSYDKAVLGSYKDHVPNHYELGYQLVASARASYGAGIWGDVLDYVGRRPYTLVPFSRGIKKHTGYNVTQLYEHTTDTLTAVWTEQRERHTYTIAERISPGHELFTSYRSLGFINDSTLMALKTGLRDIPRIVTLTADGQVDLLFTPGLYNSEVFSHGGGLIAWTELRKDPRWEHRSWSEVHVYDLNSGKKNRLTRNTRYFSPAVSPDGQHIAVTEASTGDYYALVILCSTTGDEITRLPSPGGGFLMQPQWHPSGTSLLAVVQDEAGKRIVSVNPGTGFFTTLFDAGHVNITRPRYLSNHEVAFNGAFSGIDNIYLLDKEADEVYLLISSVFGAIDVATSPDGRTLVWSDYTSGGYRAVSMTGSRKPIKTLAETENHATGFGGMLASQEESVITESLVPRHNRQIFPYRKGLNLFNIHSWGPISMNVDNRDINPGVSLMSQNALSTSVLEAGYEYDLNEELGTYVLRYSYLGFYPVLSLDAERGLRRSFYRRQDAQDELFPFIWREQKINLGVSIPLTFTRGPFFYGVNPTVKPGLTKVSRTSDAPDFFAQNELYTMAYRLFAYRQLRMVQRDMGPRRAQVIDLNYRHTPFGGTDMGSVLAARLITYFPGVSRHHSFRTSIAYQVRQQGIPKDNTINYIFPNLINYPRGISGRNDKRTWSFSADYALPVAYPDFPIPNVIYIKRISLNLFADYARATREVIPENNTVDACLQKEDLFATGADIMADVHLFRFYAPITLGLRSIYLPDTDSFTFRMLFVLNI
ncbi:MAG: hypothetical protein RG741_02500 [Bacteroidales bacterium]|nr:hypothetical protein [Bacteroidales bacterium]